MVLFSPLMTFTEKMLDVATLRHRVIANNISNINTPGFDRSEVSFKDALERIRASATEDGPMNAAQGPDINKQLMNNLTLDSLYNEGARYQTDMGVGYSLAETKFQQNFSEHAAAGPGELDPRAKPPKTLSRADFIASVQPEIVHVEDQNSRQDGNNLNPEIEMASMIKNTSFYNVLVSSISGEFRTLKTIISNR